MVLLRTLGHKVRPSTHAKVSIPAKIAAPFYRSVEWRELIANIKRVRGNRCEDAAHPPGTDRTASRIYGDHIKEIKDGGKPLEASNIMLRCPTCHQRKTAAERAKRYHRGG